MSHFSILAFLTKLALTPGARPVALSSLRSLLRVFRAIFVKYVEKIRSFEGQDLLGLLVSILVVGDFVVLQLKNVSKQGIS